MDSFGTTAAGCSFDCWQQNSGTIEILLLEILLN
jgi:hypothetical protein